MMRGMDTLLGGLSGLYRNQNPGEGDNQPRRGQTGMNSSDTGSQDPHTLHPRNPDGPQPMTQPVDNLNEYVDIRTPSHIYDLEG